MTKVFMIINYITKKLNKKMKKINNIVLALVFCNLSAQINLKHISFKQKDSITDKELYKKGLIKSIEKIKPLIDGMGKAFELEKKEDIDIKIQKEVDSIVNNISQKEIDKDIRVFHFEYIDNRVLKRWETKENGEILTYPIYLDHTKGKEYYNYPRENEEEYKYSFKKIKNLHIEIIKHKTKIINGLKCLKLLVSYTEIIEAKDYPEFPEFNAPEEHIDVKLEMWVTKDIKTLYHPILKIKEVLESFYPLEINESSDAINGSIRKYTLKEIIKT
ncbi:hypothetical protein SDC9_01832 [bioreactor metagenome]|uniref:Uncharacterized protein n=1 Tax=bioreactor metagenome TaxID=1076179 RepID=A0A644SNY2_9ZZZZ